MGAMARKFHLGGHMARNAPRLSLPGKLVFPSTHNTGHFSMLGLGDIVMPGLLLCFVMRYDAYKRAQVSSKQIRQKKIPILTLENIYAASTYNLKHFIYIIIYFSSSKNN